MPQMEKFGKASATTTVTSADGSSSRARSAALIPASLPPIMTRCMPAAFLSSADSVGGVRDDDLSGFLRRDLWIQDPDHDQSQGPADHLSADEHRGRCRRDARERVG